MEHSGKPLSGGAGALLGLEAEPVEVQTGTSEHADDGILRQSTPEATLVNLKTTVDVLSESTMAHAHYIPISHEWLFGDEVDVRYDKMLIELAIDDLFDGEAIAILQVEEQPTLQAQRQQMNALTLRIMKELEEEEQDDDEPVAMLDKADEDEDDDDDLY